MWGAIAKGAVQILAWIGIDAAFDKWVKPWFVSLSDRGDTTSRQLTEEDLSRALRSNKPDEQAKAFAVLLVSTLSKDLVRTDVFHSELDATNQQLRSSLCGSLCSNQLIDLGDRIAYASSLVPVVVNVDSQALLEMYLRYCSEQGVDVVTPVGEEDTPNWDSLKTLFENLNSYAPETYMTVSRFLIAYEMAMDGIPEREEVKVRPSSVGGAQSGGVQTGSPVLNPEMGGPVSVTNPLELGALDTRSGDVQYRDSDSNVTPEDLAEAAPEFINIYEEPQIGEEGTL